MGHLDQPLNTFWQLFFRPRGLSRWSDEDTALAVATNGGLVLSTLDGRSLAVGIRPANLLDFSPVLVTSNGGRSWSPAAPIAALAKQPDALSVGTGGRALALSSNATGDEVLESSAGLAGWRPLTTTSELASTAAGRACGLVSMTAVRVAAAGSVVGASCRRPGVVGIFSRRAGGWHLAGLRLPSSLARGSVAVVGLQPTTGGLCALLGVSGADSTSLLAAWTTDGGTAWREGPALDLGSRHLLSFGPAGGMGLFVLTSGTAASASDSAEVVSGPGAAWHRLPAPPADTATLVFGPLGGVDALVASDTVFTDLVLASRSHTWTRAQVINVPLQFGSSS
jgi:hypothetical protein